MIYGILPRHNDEIIFVYTMTHQVNVAKVTIVWDASPPHWLITTYLKPQYFKI